MPLYYPAGYIVDTATNSFWFAGVGILLKNVLLPAIAPII